MCQDGTRKRMEEGKLYYPGDTQILKEQEQYMELLYDYNTTRPGEGEKQDPPEKMLVLWGTSRH